MDERKWIRTSSPNSMLDFVQHHSADGRKTRLFASAAMRSLWAILPDLRSRRAVEVAEAFADRLVSFDELRGAEEEASRIPQVVDTSLWGGSKSRAAWGAAATAAFQHRQAAGAAVLAVVGCGEPVESQRKWLCDLLREVFGNPFRPVVLDPDWRSANDGLAPRLAREIYDTRRFGELPVVADALEDAGCDLRELLDHLRRPGGHVRGCWALDAVLDLK
jgi:hypothetical protein